MYNIDPNCTTCNKKYDTEHYIFECSDLTGQRNKLLSGLKNINITPTLKNILFPPKTQSSAVYKLLETFIKETDFLLKI